MYKNFAIGSSVGAFLLRLKLAILRCGLSNSDSQASSKKVWFGLQSDWNVAEEGFHGYEFISDLEELGGLGDGECR